MPGRRRLRRPVHGEHDGDRLRVSRHRGARQRQRAGDRSRQRSRWRAGLDARVMSLVARGHAAARDPHASGIRRMRSPRSRPRADRPTRCCTCSQSRAKRACRSSSTRSMRSAPATPVVADLKPSGRFVATDLHARRRQRARRAAARRREASWTGGTMTVTGRYARPRKRRPRHATSGTGSRARSRQPDQAERRPGRSSRDAGAGGRRAEGVGRPSAARTAVPRGCSTARRPRSPRCRVRQSGPAMSS